MIVCVAVVGQKNNPLFIEVFSKQEALPFHYIVHCALDAVEEKGEGFMCSLHRRLQGILLGALLEWQNLMKHKGLRNDGGQLFWHLLQLLRCKGLDGVQVYGYISNTRIKFLLVLNEQASREDEIRLVRVDTFRLWHAMQIFQRFHAAYVDAISDPFYTMDTVSHRHC
eukprot:jgi/Astpho2/6222/Aster-03629